MHSKYPKHLFRRQAIMYSERNWKIQHRIRVKYLRNIQTRWIQIESKYSFSFFHFFFFIRPNQNFYQKIKLNSLDSQLATRNICWVKNNWILLSRNVYTVLFVCVCVCRRQSPFSIFCFFHLLCFVSGNFIPIQYQIINLFITSKRETAAPNMCEIRFVVIPILCLIKYAIILSLKIDINEWMKMKMKIHPPPVCFFSVFTLCTLCCIRSPAIVGWLTWIRTCSEQHKIKYKSQKRKKKIVGTTKWYTGRWGNMKKTKNCCNRKSDVDTLKLTEYVLAVGRASNGGRINFFSSIRTFDFNVNAE